MKKKQEFSTLFDVSSFSCTNERQLSSRAQERDLGSPDKYTRGRLKTTQKGLTLRHILNKAGFSVIFTPGVSLQDIICGKNKTKFPPRQVIYKLNCDCKDDARNAYIGKTTRKAKARMAEHKGYVRRGEWHMSGIAAHKEHCKEGTVNFDDPTILATIYARSKRQADFKLDHMEALMIKLH